MNSFKVIQLIVPLLLFSTTAFLSCSKQPGEGGNATIYGKIAVRDYNAEFTSLKEEYDAQDEDVYIIYGDDRSYGNRVKTSYNGTYEFRYLYPGDYTIYCYSKDSSLSTNAMIVRLKKVTVNKKMDDVNAGTITILK